MLDRRLPGIGPVGSVLAVTMRGGDGVLVLASGLAVVAGVVTAIAGVRAGITVLAVAVALALLALARVSQLVLRRLGQLDHLTDVAHDTRRITRQSQLVGKRVGRRTKFLVSRTGNIQRHQQLDRERLNRVGDEVRRSHAEERQHHGRTRRELDLIASDTVRLSRLAHRVAPGDDSLPGLGGWALTPATLLDLVDEVERRTGPVTILECGSGTSTLFLSLVLAHRGQGGRVVALEADAGFAEETRGHLRRYGVEGVGTVVDAPLVPHRLADGSTQPWFDLTGLPDLEPVDLLFVDGPVGDTSHQARYPAIQLVGDRLAPGACVVLDDTNRPDERAILDRWVAEGHGAALTVEREHGRSTRLRVGSLRS